jgi:hypothetical protein
MEFGQIPIEYFAISSARDGGHGIPSGASERERDSGLSGIKRETKTQIPSAAPAEITKQKERRQFVH